jgi:hypothetical protein
MSLSTVLKDFLTHAVVAVDQAAAAELLPLVVTELENLEKRLASHESRLASLGGYDASGGNPGGGTPPETSTPPASPAPVTGTPTPAAVTFSAGE